MPPRQGIAAVRAAARSPLALALDVTEPDAAERVLEACGDDAPDVLVNNVGHFLVPPEPFAESEPAGWEAVEAVNLTHVLRLTRALLPGMIAAGRGGSIVNPTTVEAFRGIPGHAVYAACKAAVTQFGRSLAVEVGRHGIRVNAIAPDVVETPQLPYSDWVPEEESAGAGGPGRRSAATGRPTTSPARRSSSPRRWAPSSPARRSTWTAARFAAGGWYPRHGGGWTNRPLDP